MNAAQFKTAWRSLRRQMSHTVINIAGLALGIAVCLLISLYVRHELSYDTFHDEADRIYRVTSDWGDFQMPVTTWPAARTIIEQNPSLTVTPFFREPVILTKGQQSIRQRNAFVVKPSFFDVFTFPLARGTVEDAFTRPNTVALTPEVAAVYFGDADPMGKTLRVAGIGAQSFDVEVAGILEPIPDASHVHPEILFSWETVEAQENFSERRANSWGNNSMRTYLKVPEGVAPAVLADRFLTQGKERAGGRWNGATIHLQALTDIHLHSSMSAELEPNGRMAYIWLFGAVAAFVLLLACVNFVNLATARAADRAREVGVRKTVGAHRGQLVQQFMTEALLLSAFALGVAVLLTYAAMPLFRLLTETTTQFQPWSDPFAILFLVGITLVAGVGAGSYPAFILSSFDPSDVLRGRSRSAGHGALLRKGLVLFQFATAVALIAGTMAAFLQLNYLRDADLGFDQEQVLTLSAPPTDNSAAYRSFLSSVREKPGVESVALASESLPSELLSGNTFAWEGLGIPADSMRGLRVVAVSHGFFEAMGVGFLSGRAFERGRPADSSGVVLNARAVEVLSEGYAAAPHTPTEAEGKSLDVYGGWPMPEARVLGVVSNFHYATMHDQIDPIAFFLYPPMLDTYYVRVNAQTIDASLGEVQAAWQQFFPNAPFAYRFADASFEQAYRSEQRLGTLFSVFAGLAVVVALLGLFGLASFTAATREKEVGIRKAIGATSPQIVTLLSKDFATLIGASIVVATPIAYVALDGWLDTFAYRIDLGPSIFFGAGLLALLVGLATVSFHAVRAARIDPAQTLRSE